MKKLLILFSFTLAFCSCVREQFPFSGREIAFSVSMRGTATKAASNPDETFLMTIPVQMEDGTEVLLEAWLSDTETSQLVATKGAQIHGTKDDVLDDTHIAKAYGSFVTTVYEGNGVYNYDFAGEHSILKDITVSFVEDAENVWKFGDKTYYWPDEYNRPLTFCSYSPASDSGITNFVYDGKDVSFDYFTPVQRGQVAAELQRDLLVALDPNQSRTKKHGNAEVNFRHALTSVKFVCKDWNGVQVDSIRLENFYKEGRATLSEDGAFSWSVSGDPTNFTQSFGTTPSESGKDNNGNYILDDSGIRTFMVIPQKLHQDAKITVFLDRTHGEVSIDISELSELRDNQVPTPNKLDDWSKYAGKTITFRINNNKIDDQFVVVPQEGGESFNVKATGNPVSDFSVRAALVVNIEDKNHDVLTSYLFTGDSLIEGWLSFNVDESNWTKGDDGFYYYKGQTETITSQDGAPFITNFSFDQSKISFTDTSDLPTKPEHFEASIIVQGCLQEDFTWNK